MSQWIITPDKYLNEEEEKAIRNTALDLSIIAKSRGNQIDVRNHLIIEVVFYT
jgi:hypothetical protein